MRIIGNDPSVPRQTQEVASGTLPNGRPVVVNADGTVAVVAETSISQNIGTAVVYSSSSGTEYHAAVYDASADRIVLVYKDTSNSDYGTYVVGTVSGTSISFSTPAVFNSNSTSYLAATYDPDDQKIVVAFEDGGNNSYGTAMVGSVSGSSVSFGGKSVFNNNGTTRHIASTYDTSANKHIFTFAWNTFWSACTATVSSGSISFGSVLELHQSSNQYRYTSCAYDEAADKTVVVGVDLGNSTRAQVRVVTVSGTSLSKGNATQLSTNSSSSTACAYDASVQKVVISQNTSNDGDSYLGTISGTTITFGSHFQFTPNSCGRVRSVYDPDAQKVIIFFQDNSNEPTIRVATVDNTGSISFSSKIELDDRNMNTGAIAYDTNSNQTFAAWSNTQDSQGEALMFRNAYTQRNLTSENYIGMSGGTAFQTGSAASVGSPTAFVSADSGVNAMAFDSSNNKVVIAYRDTNNYGFAVVATVSGSSVSFGTPVAYRSANIVNHQSVVFDSNANKVVVFYGISSTTKAKVGTVSGTSISFGSEASVHNESDVKFDGTFDSTNNKVVVTYRGANSYVEAKVGTISGTDITFGTAVVAMSLATDDNRATFDSNRGKVVICSRISTKGRAVVGTVSGTSISFASNVIFADNQTKNLATTFDSSNNKVVIAFQNGSSADEGQAVVGDIDGSGVISFGSAVEYDANANGPQGIAFDSNLNKIVIAYDATDTNKGQVISGTVSGTSITFDSELVFDDSGVTSAACAFDSNANKILIAYQDDGNSYYGTGVVFTPTSLVTTRGQVADGGHALIDTQGAISDNQIGLTAGQSYFVQNDGTIGTTAADPSVFAGTAVSSTKLIVKG